MRLFIAIELPDDVRRHLVRLRDRLRREVSKASFTRDENLHITLKFLGEVEDKRVPELLESLGKVRIGGAIQLHPQQMEFFPKRGPVRIIAVGFGGSVDALAGLHRAIEQRCQHVGFERETRAYRPHVTLARARPTLPAPLRKSGDDVARGHFPGPAFQVDEFVLVQSTLRPQGSEYTVAARFPLKS